MKTGLFAFALLLSLSASAQTRVSGYAPGQNEEGVTYFLPQTTLSITVVAEKTVFTPATFVVMPRNTCVRQAFPHRRMSNGK